MNVEFMVPAQREFAEAIAYYNGECEGLGYRFALEVKRALARITQYPQAWPSLSKRTRRCRTNGFPYGIIYQVQKDVILVVAVMHLQRHPASWKAKIS